MIKGIKVIKFQIFSSVREKERKGGRKGGKDKGPIRAAFSQLKIMNGSKVLKFQFFAFSSRISLRHKLSILWQIVKYVEDYFFVNMTIFFASNNYFKT